eukprot:518709_1
MANNNADEEKINIGLAVVGDLDSGKSTLCGRFLYELGLLTLQELQSNQTYAWQIGKESHQWAFFMDKASSERYRGISIVCTAKKFTTDKYNYNIIDTPGHCHFVKNTIHGISRADAAILVISAENNAFEKSIIRKRSTIFLGQTRHHGRLCWLMGVKQLIICINKMDKIKYNEKRFIEIKNKTIKLLHKIGFKKTHKIPFIPISAINNDNLNTKSKNMNWWNGFIVTIKNKKIYGNTLYHALNKVIKKPKRNKFIKNKEFLMPICNVYKIRGIGDVITGRIEHGKINLSINNNCYIYPKNYCANIFTIKQMFGDNINSAKCGDYIGCNVKGLNKDKMPRKGDVMMISNSKLQKNIKKVLQFEALVYVENHCGKLKCRQLRTNCKYKSKKSCKCCASGYTPIIYVRTAKSPCKLIKILWKKKYGSNKEVAYFPKYIEYGDLAQVIFEPMLAIYMTPFNECEAFGRIAIMDHNYLIMIGKVLYVYYEKDKLNGINCNILLNGYIRIGMKNIKRNNAIIPFEIINLINVFYGSYDMVVAEQYNKKKRVIWEQGWDYDPEW